MLHQLTRKLLEVGLQILYDRLVVALHEHADRVEHIFEEGLAEVGSAGLPRGARQRLEASLQPNIQIDSLRVADDCLQQVPGLIQVEIGPEERVYLFQVVEDALPAHGPLLDLVDGGVELVLHVGQVLGDAGVIVVVAREVEVAGGCLVLWAQGEGEGVEVLGLF